MILAGAKVGLSKKDKSRNKQGKNKNRWGEIKPQPSLPFLFLLLSFLLSSYFQNAAVPPR
jgi:hypothetical protein